MPLNPLVHPANNRIARGVRAARVVPPEREHLRARVRGGPVVVAVRRALEPRARVEGVADLALPVRVRGDVAGARTDVVWERKRRGRVEASESVGGGRKCAETKKTTLDGMRARFRAV